MYHPVLNTRYFTFDKRYSDINWNSFADVVEAYRQQIEYWYILPCLELMKNRHFGFPVVALTSMLVDTLSQYESGALNSSKELFKKFLRKNIPQTGVCFPAPIKTAKGEIKDGADALYHGIRCGILHEAHSAIYTTLTEQNDIIVYNPTGVATYDDGSDCPVVSVAPNRYFEKVNAVASHYLNTLLNPNFTHDSLRQSFKKNLKHPTVLKYA